MQKGSAALNLIRTGDAEFRLSFVICARRTTIENRWRGGRITMLSKITLALAIVMAALALAAVPVSPGPNDTAQIRSSSSDSIANSGGAGGNLVTLW
jgi:hypothetical protein